MPLKENKENSAKKPPTVQSLSKEIGELQTEMAKLVRALQSGETTGTFTIELKISPEMVGLPDQFRDLVRQFIRTNWQHGLRDIAFTFKQYGMLDNAKMISYFADGSIETQYFSYKNSIVYKDNKYKEDFGNFDVAIIFSLIEKQIQRKAQKLAA